jgi:soluble lytic murein transglycosylase-like protein
MRRALALLLVAMAGSVFAARIGTVRADDEPFRAGAARAAVVPARTPEVAVSLRRPAHGTPCPVPARYRAAFEAAAAASHLPVAILVSMAQVESGGNSDALSAAGARGMLQLMPATAASMSLDPDLPESNILGGARYLRQMLDRFGSIDLALAAYNAGPTAVARAGGAPTGETLTYVANVKAEWRSMTGCT